MRIKERLPFILVGLVFFSFIFFFKKNTQARPEYAAFDGSNCMACHISPTGGFGRRPTSPNDVGYVNEQVNVTGDLQFLALSDQRDPGKDRFVFFPMQGALHLAWKLTPKLTIAGSQDFGILREVFGVFHNIQETLYVKAGFFTLPYGLLFPDHTSFIKEGRVEAGERTFEEKGIGAGLFGVRYKDSGVEAGFNGKHFFANLAMTSGVVGQRERAFPSSQGGNKKAFTRRAGFVTRNIALGGSVYSNDNEVLDRRILRYGGFGWFKLGPFALLFEHDEGDEEAFTVSGSTQISASYAELVYKHTLPNKDWTSYAKVRYERLDPNRSLDNDLLQRWVFSYRTNPLEYLALEAFYRINKEEPTEKSNDDIFLLTHLFSKEPHLASPFHGEELVVEGAVGDPVGDAVDVGFTQGGSELGHGVAISTHIQMRAFEFVDKVGIVWVAGDHDFQGDGLFAGFVHKRIKGILRCGHIQVSSGIGPVVMTTRHRTAQKKDIGLDGGKSRGAGRATSRQDRCSLSFFFGTSKRKDQG